MVDEKSYTKNVFFSRPIEDCALEDFEFGKAYAVRIENTAIFDKAKHCLSIVAYSKVTLQF